MSSEQQNGLNTDVTIKLNGGPPSPNVTPISDANRGQATNSREATFQKLRQRIMLNKLHKNNTPDNRSPIRPSLYRKYPKRKPGRSKNTCPSNIIAPSVARPSQEGSPGFMTKPPEEPKVQQIEVPPGTTATWTDDYQRYYLQPVNQLGSFPNQIPIKIEPNGDLDKKEEPGNDDIQVLDIKTNHKEETSTPGQNVIKVEKLETNGVQLIGKGVKRNLELGFGGDVQKNTDEAERIWLRALKEEGVKEVKRTENETVNNTCGGLSREYQNEFSKFIEGRDFSKEAKQTFSTGSKKIENVPCVAAQESHARNRNSGNQNAEDAFELRDFCSSLMARHPLYLHQSEDGSGDKELPPKSGQVVFVPKLVPYPPNQPAVNVPDPTKREDVGVPVPTLDGMKVGHARIPPTPFAADSKYLPMYLPTSAAPGIEHLFPVQENSQASHLPARVLSDEDEQSTVPSHSRRKQTAPRKRKPKEEDENDSTPNSRLESDRNIPRNSIQLEKEAPNSEAQPGPNPNIAYAYIAIPVSALASNTLLPTTQVPNGNQRQDVTPIFPTFPAPEQLNALPQRRSDQVNNQVMDLSNQQRQLTNGQPHPRTLPRPVQPVQPLPVPVNPFARNGDPPPRSQPEFSRKGLGNSQESLGVSQRPVSGQLMNFQHNQRQAVSSAPEMGHPAKFRPVYVASTPPAPKSQSAFRPIAVPLLQAQDQPRDNRMAPQAFRQETVPRFCGAARKPVQQIAPANGRRVNVPQSENRPSAPSSSGIATGPQMFVPMRFPVPWKNTPEVPNPTSGKLQRPVPVYTGSAPLSSLPKPEVKNSKASQYIDLTDDGDDIEDVYSPFDNDVTLTFVTSGQSAIGNITARVGQEGNNGRQAEETLEEEQMRLMDNVSKLVEINSEVGALINESSQILDTLAPPAGSNTDDNEAKKCKRKKGNLNGRKLMKYDSKGRRIFKFHYYLPNN